MAYKPFTKGLVGNMYYYVTVAPGMQGGSGKWEGKYAGR
jgi:hypothetical protein